MPGQTRGFRELPLGLGEVCVAQSSMPALPTLDPRQAPGFRDQQAQGAADTAGPLGDQPRAPVSIDEVTQDVETGPL